MECEGGCGGEVGHAWGCGVGWLRARYVSDYWALGRGREYEGCIILLMGGIP